MAPVTTHPDSPYASFDEGEDKPGEDDTAATAVAPACAAGAAGPGAPQLRRRGGAPSLCRMSSVLSYGALLGLLSGSLMGIVVPTEMGLFEPKYAARANGALIAVGCAFSILAPLFGTLSDRFGSRRPLMVAGALATMGAIAGMLAAVSGLLGARSTVAFLLYCVCYIVMQIGLTCLNVSFSGILADYGKLLPAKMGTIGGLWSLFNLAGAALGYVLSGMVLPVDADSHVFYYVLAVVMGVANLGLVRLPTVLLRTETATTAKTSSASTANAVHRHPIKHMLSAWLCAPEYAAFRMVCLSRLIFFFGLGVFATMMLFFFEDQTDAKSDASKVYASVALISLACSLAAVVPAGKLSDKFGMGPVAAVGGCVMAGMLAGMSSMSTTTAIMCVVPLYGIGQQFYNVGDLGLVIQSVPRDDTRARDMGAWSAGQAVGQAWGSAFAGFAISYFHEAPPAHAAAGSSSSSPSPAPASPSHPGVEQRLPYSRLGYQVVFLTAAAAMVLSCFVVWLAVRRLGAAAAPASPDDAAAEDERRDLEGQ